MLLLKNQIISINKKEHKTRVNVDRNTIFIEIKQRLLKNEEALLTNNTTKKARLC